MKNEPLGEFYKKSIEWDNDKFAMQIILVYSKETGYVDFNTNIHFK